MEGHAPSWPSQSENEDEDYYSSTFPLLAQWANYVLPLRGFVVKIIIHLSGRDGARPSKKYTSGGSRVVVTV